MVTLRCERTRTYAFVLVHRGNGPADRGRRLTATEPTEPGTRSEPRRLRGTTAPSGVMRLTLEPSGFALFRELWLRYVQQTLTLGLIASPAATQVPVSRPAANQ